MEKDIRHIVQKTIDQGRLVEKIDQLQIDREYVNIVDLSIYTTHTNLTSLTDAIDQTTSASQAIIILINVSTSNLCSVNFCFGHFSQHQTKVGKREKGEEEKGSKIFIIENVFCHWIG